MSPPEPVARSRRTSVWLATGLQTYCALAAAAEVDRARIGLAGICLGGGYAIRAAAQDPRVRAVAGIAGGYNSPAEMAASMGIGEYRSALGAFLDRYDSYLPAVAADGAEAAMGGDEPYAYYGTSRSRSPHWRNEVTRGSLHSLMTFDALGAAELLGETPLLVVHGERDAYCSRTSTTTRRTSPRPRPRPSPSSVRGSRLRSIDMNLLAIGPVFYPGQQLRFSFRSPRPVAPGTSPGRPGRKPRSPVPPR